MMWTVEAQEWNTTTKVYSWIGDEDSWRAGEGITEVPNDIPAQAVEVWLNWNQIEVIRQNSFSHLNACKRLGLWSNKIHTIESGAWNGLVRLRVLTLYNNKLEVLRPGMWSGLNTCTWLDLTWNKIHTIQSGTFRDGLSNVKQLHLQENDIEEIKKGMFLGLTQCTQLFLNGNKIYTIHSGGLEGLYSLTLLWLLNNELSILHWTVFGNQHPAQLGLHLEYNPSGL